MTLKKRRASNPDAGSVYLDDESKVTPWDAIHERVSRFYETALTSYAASSPADQEKMKKAIVSKVMERAAQDPKVAPVTDEILRDIRASK